MSKVTIERELVPVSFDVRHDPFHRNVESYVEFACIRRGHIFTGLDDFAGYDNTVKIEGLSRSEILPIEQSIKSRGTFHMVLSCDIPDTTAPDLLTKAAAKAKAGDVKEAVKLAVEALQKIAEGSK